MRLREDRTTPSGEDGFALIEVVISGLIAVIAAGAVMTLMQAVTRSAAGERSRSQSYALAQADQTRLRAMRLPSLKKLNETRTVTLDGREFEVKSTAQHVNDVSGGDAGCGTGLSTADYVRLSSEVTWKGMSGAPPTTIRSIVAPSSGSLDPNSGNLIITATNAANVGIPKVGLFGSGPTSFSGTTDTNGCAFFSERGVGNYTLTPSGVASGLIDKDGNAPGPITIGVSGAATNSVVLLFDKPGSVPVKFTTKNYSGSVIASSSDSMIAFNTGMSTAKLVGTPEGTRKNILEATSLFPFTSPDTFYAGSCSTNNPKSPAPASASVLVPAGGEAATQTIQLPPLRLTVEDSDDDPIDDAKVLVSDDNCEVNGHDVTRVYETNSSGRLSNPGLPWGTYDVCASAWVYSSGWKIRYDDADNVKLDSLDGGSATIRITSNDSSVSC
ncbi:MAG: hypothetical protein WD827_05835 [Solirubrobacterales bacterium]